MEEVSLISEAYKFVVLGMGIVFLFLTILVFILKLQAKLIAKYFPEKTDSITIPQQWQPDTLQNNDEKIVAAITAAIIHYKNKG